MKKKKTGLRSISLDKEASEALYCLPRKSEVRVKTMFGISKAAPIDTASKRGSAEHHSLTIVNRTPRQDKGGASPDNGGLWKHYTVSERSDGRAVSPLRVN